MLKKNILNIDFSPFPVLKTERLVLRRFNNNDADDLFALRSNPDIMKFIPRPLAKTTVAALAHITIINDKIDANEGINWAICLKDDLKFVGLTGLFKIFEPNFRAEIYLNSIIRASFQKLFLL